MMFRKKLPREVKLADNCKINFEPYHDDVVNYHVNKLLLDWVKDNHAEVVVRAERAVRKAMSSDSSEDESHNKTDTKNNNLSGGLLNEQC